VARFEQPEAASNWFIKSFGRLCHQAENDPRLVFGQWTVRSRKVGVSGELATPFDGTSAAVEIGGTTLEVVTPG